MSVAAPAGEVALAILGKRPDAAMLPLGWGSLKGLGRACAVIGAAVLLHGAASACTPLPTGIQLRNELGVALDVVPSATPFAAGEVSLVQQQPKGAQPPPGQQFGCTGPYAYLWVRTYGGYAGFVSKDVKATIEELNASAPGVSIGCTAIDGPAPDYCEILVTTLQDPRKPASVAFGFQIDRIPGRDDVVCLGSGLEAGSTMQIQIDGGAPHAATVADGGSSCFDAAASAQILAELAAGSALEVQVLRVGESKYHKVSGDTAALADALRLSQFLQSKTMAIQ